MKSFSDSKFIMSNRTFIITPANQKLFKETVLNYLNGTYTIDQTRIYMRLACMNQGDSISAKQFAQTIGLNDDSNTSLDPTVIKILEHLKMKTQTTAYAEQGIATLYDLIRKQKDLDLDYLIEMIDELYPTVPLLKYIYRPALFTIGILSFSYLQPQYFWMAIDWVTDILPVAYYWLHHNVVQLNNWPIIGMGMQIAWLAYYLRYTFQHGLDPSDERVRTLTFRAFALTLTFLGHLLSYSAAGALSWGPALFFIASSLVSIVESIHFYVTQKVQAPPDSQADVHIKALHIRQTHIQDRNFYYFLVRLIHAIAITSLLIFCTLLPSSLILTITYTLSLSLSFLIKDYCIELIKQSTVNSEQTAVTSHYHEHENTLDKEKEKEKAKFQGDATMIILSYSDDKQKQLVLRNQMNEFLASTDFVYDIASKDFKRCVTVADGVSPSPQSNTQTPVSNSRYALHSNPQQQTTPSRVRLEDTFESTPVGGENNDSKKSSSNAHTSSLVLTNNEQNILDFSLNT